VTLLVRDDASMLRCPRGSYLKRMGECGRASAMSTPCFFGEEPEAVA